jgi:hypothetical protein
MEQWTAIVREENAVYMDVPDDLDTDKKKVNLFCPVTLEEYNSGDPVDENRKSLCYSPKRVKVSQPGSVYEAEVLNQDESIFYNTVRYVGQWKNEEQRNRWQGQHRAKVVYEEAKKLEEKDKVKSVLHECLDPLRQVYKGLPYQQRQAFIAAILYHITR